MPEEITPFDATALDDAALHTEYSRIRERGNELAGRTEALSADEETELTELSARVDVVNAELSARTERANAVSAPSSTWA
jgi:hypothetical protein